MRTVPDVAADMPADALPVFGTALDTARGFARLLASEGVTRGLLGPREASRLWDRHLMNCAVVAEIVPSRGVLVDIGSGAGLPGIVLAMLRPELEVILLEPMLRRVTFLQECVAALSLPNATVTRARAEELKGKIRADVVTARAVAPLDRLAGWAAGLLGPGGSILAIKGESAEAEIEAARSTLSRLGARSTEVLRLGHGSVVPATTVVRVVLGQDVLGRRGREEQAGAHRRRPGVA